MAINFFKGHPTTRLLPGKELSETFTQVLNQNYDQYEDDADNQHPLAYGTDPGNLDIRTTISKWIGSFYNRDDDPKCINLTAGASYGMANILTAFTNTNITKQAFIVTPTYFLINGTFLDVEFEGKLTAIDETKHYPSSTSKYDIDLEYLESKLKEFSTGLPPISENTIEDPERGKWKFYRFVIYLVPTYSNPGGITYSLPTLKKLLELAREYDLLIVTDDVYDLLNYGEEPNVPKLVHLDCDICPNLPYGNVISNCTFSKICAPGLRMGWQEMASSQMVWQLANTGANKSGGTPGQLASFAIQTFIESGKLDENIALLKKVYRNRCKVLIEAIGKHLPKDTVVNGGKGGYFFWITIPGDIDHNKVVQKLSEENVILASGDHFEVSGDPRHWGKNSVRLSISYLEEEKIILGIEKWGTVLKQEYPHLYDK